MSDSVVRLRTEAFDFICRAKGYKTHAAKAQALGVSYSQLQKVRAGTSQPGPMFIHATLALLGVQYAEMFALGQLEPQKQQAA